MRILLALLLICVPPAFAQEEASNAPPEEGGGTGGDEQAETAPEAAVEEGPLPPDQIDVRPKQPGTTTYKDLVASGTIVAAIGGGIMLAAMLSSSLHMRALGASEEAQRIAWIPFGGPIAAEIYDEEEMHYLPQDRYREGATGHMIFEIASFVTMAIGLESVREGLWWKRKLWQEEERRQMLEGETSFLLGPGRFQLSGRFP